MTAQELFLLADYYRQQASCERGEKNYSVIFAMWLDAQAGFLEREAKAMLRNASVN
jgi:hypothetical protein